MESWIASASTFGHGEEKRGHSTCFWRAAMETLVTYGRVRVDKTLTLRSCGVKWRPLHHVHSVLHGLRWSMVLDAFNVEWTLAAFNEIYLHYSHGPPFGLSASYTARAQTNKVSNVCRSLSRLRGLYNTTLGTHNATARNHDENPGQHSSTHPDVSRRRVSFAR